MQIMSRNESAGACGVLIEEQQSIKSLFRKFDEAEGDSQKKSIGDACLRAIEVTIALEEEVLYPSVRRTLGERQRVVQALASNQVSKLLVKELKAMPAGEQYNARFTLLKDNVAQHFDTVGAEIFPKVDESSIDAEQFGKELLTFKGRFMRTMPATYNKKRVAAVAAGVLAVAGAVWLMRRNRGGSAGR